jgi:hypothetical protein
LQSASHAQLCPSHEHELEAHPAPSTHDSPAAHPVMKHPVGLGSAHPTKPQVLPKQQLGSPAGHQSQQNFPG